MTVTTELRGLDDLRQFVSFRLGPEEYAVDVGQIQEIIRLTTITAVPRTASHVQGVVNLRGRIVPVIDLACLLGLQPAERGKAAHIVITQVAGRTVGMRVDAVNEVVRIAAGAIEPPPAALLDGVRTDFIVGIGKHGDRLLIVLDLPRVLSAQEAADVADAADRSGDLAG